VITSGEPSGIGPDICVLLSQQSYQANLTVIGDLSVLKARAQSRGLDLVFIPYQSTAASTASLAGTLQVLDTAVACPVHPGKLDSRNSHYVLNMLNRAANACSRHMESGQAWIEAEFDAMVTAPVHKGVINEAGIAFSGHTEYLAELSNTKQVVMMLVGGQDDRSLRVALATTHLALKDVPAAIQADSLETTIRILHADLVAKFGLNNPRILVAGLNPHAGEDGYLGREEIDIINPVLNKLRQKGMQLIGALPADTLFAKHHLDKADAVLAMYHDQGLPVLKHASFGQGVNVTLGLPIIRTSVDHGTALDLAGTGHIEIGSIQAAIQLAITLANHQRT
jgi:4-hydroxythreonine-4-phosphate dehydrogenase